MIKFKKYMQWILRHRLISGVVAIGVIWCVVFLQRFHDQTEGIFTQPLSRGTIVSYVYGIGTVMSNKIYRIMPGVFYTVKDIYIKEGDLVKKGDKLVLSDTGLYTAPFGGSVTSLTVRVGENVPPSVPILALIDLQDRYLLVSMEQQGALKVDIGQKVKMSFDTIRSQNYDGKVMAVYSSDINYLARIDIGFLPKEILPGMTADVAIEINRHENALLVPVAALEFGRQVWRKRGGEIPKQIPVKVGIVDKDQAEITEGDIQETDRLLIRKRITE